MLRSFLPYPVQRELFGDRRRWGSVPPPGDADWEHFLEVYPQIYREAQRSGAGARVNDAGYRVLDGVDVTGLSVAEIGPGGAFHLDRIQGRPAAYNIVDVEERFLEIARAKATARGWPVRAHLSPSREPRLPFADRSQDIVLSFYSLEHLAPLAEWVDEIARVIKPGGRIIGAIPAEGGVAWGMGRWLTTRPLMRKKYGVDVLKVICWEHVNFCDDVLQALTRVGTVSSSRWPLAVAPLDLNLIVRFVVEV